MRLFFVVVWFCAALQAQAGGDGDYFRVATISASGEDAIIVLDHIGHGSGVIGGGCKRLTILSRYDPGAWWWKKRWPPALTAAAHAEALQVLREAQQKQLIVFFGAMGSGLETDHGKPCTYRSRALQPLLPRSGEGPQPAARRWIFSYFHHV